MSYGMKKNQQFGQIKRGNPIAEQFMGSLMKEMQPPQMAGPMQMMQGGQGMMGKMGFGHGFNRQQRLGNRANLKKFLMQYSSQGKRNIKTIDINKLTKY